MDFQKYNIVSHDSVQLEEFEQSASDYLKEHRIVEYFSDALTLLGGRNEINEISFLATYFSNVVSGDNILFRDYHHLTMTQKNIQSFMKQIRDIYRTFIEQDNYVTTAGFHQILTLLCPSFPASAVKCATFFLPDPNANELTFNSLLDALGFVLKHREFLEKALIINPDTSQARPVNTEELRERWLGCCVLSHSDENEFLIEISRENPTLLIPYEKFCKLFRRFLHQENPHVENNVITAARAIADVKVPRTGAM